MNVFRKASKITLFDIFAQKIHMIKSLLILFCLSPLFCFSQAESLPTLEPAFLSIVVSDIEASAQWYEEKLGFKEWDEKGEDIPGFATRMFTNGKTTIELLQPMRAIDPRAKLGSGEQAAQVLGFYRVGFFTQEFDQWMEWWSEIGVIFEGEVKQDEEKREVTLLDPDGNRLKFIEKL